MITSLVKRSSTMNELFLDTAYAIALSVTSDANHARAVELAEQLEARQTRLITTFRDRLIAAKASETVH